MLVLALDSATPAVTAAVVRVPDSGEPRLLARSVRVDARAHAENLAPALQDALARADASPGDLGAVVVGRGPGPFTGLRVGLATALAFAQPLRLPVYGVCSLDAVVPAAAKRRYAVVTDARRREVYWAAYEPDGRRVVGPEVTRPASLPDQWRRLGVETLVGAGAVQYADVLGLPVGPPEHPDGVQLVRRAVDRIRGGAPGEQPQPLYLRRPDVREPGPSKSVLPPQ